MVKAVRKNLQGKRTNQKKYIKKNVALHLYPSLGEDPGGGVPKGDVADVCPDVVHPHTDPPEPTNQE